MAGANLVQILMLAADPLRGAPRALLAGTPAASRRAAEDSIASLRGHLSAFCADTSPDCGAWARAGECANNAGFMRGACRKACGACEADAEALINYAELALIALRNTQLARAAAGAEGDAGLGGYEAALYAAPSARPALMGALPAMADALERALDGLPPAGAPALPSATQRVGGEPTAAEAKGHGSARGREMHAALSDGFSMPALGFGTWTLTGDAAYDAVRLALDAGFRHIDSSENYQNEAEVGRALRDSGLSRAQLFVATKLSLPSSYGGPQARAALERSLAALGLQYVDLYMLHGPHADAAVLRDTWRALEAARADGLVRSLGVSNFGPAELADLEAAAPGARPSVVQNKHSVYRHGSSADWAGGDVVGALRRAPRNATLTAYCALNAWPALASPLDDARVRALAARLGATPAQLLLRWAVETGGAVLTRATTRAHALENRGALNLDLSAVPGAMEELGALQWLARAPWNRGRTEPAAPAPAGAPGEEEKAEL